MRKIYHLEQKDKHSYYGSLQAVFNANDAKDLGIALSTLQHYNWESNENKYSNEKTTLRRGVCLSASEAKKSKQDDN